MKALTAGTITAVLFVIAAQPALADDRGSRHVSYKVLTEYCATKPDSRGMATLTGRDGKKVTGFVECETEYEFHSRSNQRYSDDGHRNRGGDDDRWDDHDDDRDDDDRRGRGRDDDDRWDD